MASTNKTNHLALNQWAAEDPVLREDFNSDNTKIDTALASMSTQLAGILANAGNCRIGTGSYVGTGGTGKNAKNTLIFDRKPLYILIYDPYTGGIMSIVCDAVAPSGSDTLAHFRFYDSNFGRNIINWSGSTLTWYCEYGGNALSGTSTVYGVNQANDSGKPYYYIYLEACE